MADQEEKRDAFAYPSRDRTASVALKNVAGTRLIAALPQLKGNPAVSQSFVITNQTVTLDSYGYPAPLPAQQLYWYSSSTCSSDSNPDNYTQDSAGASSAPSGTYEQDLVSAIVASGGYVTLFVHGLGNLWDDAIVGTSAFGINIYNYGKYQGLVVGFHWPSYDESDSFAWYATSDSFPPTNTYNSIRDNINGSTQSFMTLINYLNGLSAQVKEKTKFFNLSLVCHSEGNYMAMLGLYNNTSNLFDNILLVAADINDGAVQVPVANDPNEAYMGRAQSVTESGNNITVYYTNNDDVLPASSFFYGNSNNTTISIDIPDVPGFSDSFFQAYHNPVFGGRLGLSGPNYSQGTQFSNVSAVDCSSVINLSNMAALQNAGKVPVTADGGNLSMHTSYFYIPQILSDMASVIQNQSAPNRDSNLYSGSYTMQLVSAGT